MQNRSFEVADTEQNVLRLLEWAMKAVEYGEYNEAEMHCKNAQRLVRRLYWLAADQKVQRS